MLVVKQIVKFGMVGVLGTLAHYIVLIAGVDGLGQSALLSSSLGFVLGAFINHHFNRRFTFTSEKTYGETLVQFMVSASGLFVLNIALMFLMVNVLAIQYLFAQVITTGAVFLTGFIINKFLVFKR